MMPDTNTQKNQAERREYYRFKETLIMHYTILAEDDKHLLNDSEYQQSYFIDNANQYAMDLLAEFSSMSQQIKLAIGRMNRSPEISSCFKILDTKINLLAQSVLYQDKKNDLSHHKASISAGGIAFAVDEYIATDTIISLQLVLPPELNVLTIKAKVIHCNKMPSQQYPYMLSTQFIQSNELTQDLIVRHIMYCQSSKLRSEREKAQDET